MVALFRIIRKFFGGSGFVLLNEVMAWYYKNLHEASSLICYYINWSYSWTYNSFFSCLWNRNKTKHPILESKHLNLLDLKSAASIIKKDLIQDGLGLEQVLQLKKIITSVYSNKAMNTHSVVNGTEKLDQKR